MGRPSAALSACALALLTAACGEPLVVLGDAPGLMRIVLGVGDSVGTRVDSIAVRSRLTEPTAVAFDAANGVLYVADRGAMRQVSGINTRVARIFSVTSNGRARLVLDGGGCVPGPCIVEPLAMVRAADGSLLIADGAGHRVLRYVPGGGIVVLAGTGSLGTSADGAVAAQSPVSRPRGVAVAADGSVLFSEANSHRVRAIGADGRLRTIAGSGASIHSGDGGAATAAGVPEPAGLLVIDGVLYIAEFGGATVRAVDPDGTIRTVAGTAVAGIARDGGPADQAQLNGPVALAAPADGRTVFVSDQANHRVRAISLTSGTISTFAGTGATAWTGSRRAAGETALAAPAGLEVAGGFLFIADRGHSVIWRTSITIE